MMAMATSGIIGAIYCMGMEFHTLKINTAVLYAPRCAFHVLPMPFFVYVALQRERCMHFVMTAFAGSFSVVLGADFFAKTGFATWFMGYLDPNSDEANPVNIGDVIIVIVLFILTGIFMVVQSYYSNRNSNEVSFADVITGQNSKIHSPYQIKLDSKMHNFHRLLYFLSKNKVDDRNYVLLFFERI
jgi:membrane protein insertase Oxa1/YidC/SpoIIIJ